MTCDEIIVIVVLSEVGEGIGEVGIGGEEVGVADAAAEIVSSQVLDGTIVASDANLVANGLRDDAFEGEHVAAAARGVVQGARRGSPIDA